MNHHEAAHCRTPDGSRHAPAITPLWKRMTVGGNLLLGSVELFAGNFDSLAVAADGVHNIGDAVTYNLQSDDLLRQDMSRMRLQRRRKAAHWIIAVSSGAIAAKAGIDLAGGASHQAQDLALYAASASVLFNGGLLYRLRQGITRQHKLLGPDIDCHREKDLTKHFLRLDIPSAGLALGGVVAQKYGFEDAEQLAGIASGLLGVVAFRPTRKNLAHIH